MSAMSIRELATLAATEMTVRQSMDELRAIERARRELGYRLSPDVVLAVVTALEKSADRLIRFDLPATEINNVLELLNRPNP